MDSCVVVVLGYHLSDCRAPAFQRITMLEAIVDEVQMGHSQLVLNCIEFFAVVGGWIMGIGVSADEGLPVSQMQA